MRKSCSDCGTNLERNNVCPNYDLGETFRAMREESRERRSKNLEDSIQILVQRKVVFERLSQDHLRIDRWDFWPSTGLYIERATGLRGRGVFQLLRKINGGAQ